MTTEERFWSKVDLDGPGGCWVWTAFTSSQGYGSFRGHGRLVLAHRFAYELLVGPIPGGLELDHLCRNRSCVNPDHLEAVDHVTNVRRGEGGQNMAAKTHCPQGHAYGGGNLRMNPSGSRVCRECQRLACRRYRMTNQPEKVQA